MKELCKQYIAAKNAESEAKENRLVAEAKLLAAINPSKLEGTETKATDGFKIYITNKLTRSLDYPAYKSLELPDKLAFVDMKPSLNIKNLRMIERIDPALVAKCVTVKPAKPTIKIEPVEVQ
jgi:hypothetical protein